MTLRATICIAAFAVAAAASLPMSVAHAEPAAPAAQPAAGDVSGTYTWENNMGGGGGGGGGQATTLTLKQDGTKLTGTISGRGGDTPIGDGTVDGKTIKFTVTREFNNNKIVTNYAGTVTDSGLKLTVTTSREIEAKKQS